MRHVFNWLTALSGMVFVATLMWMIISPRFQIPFIVAGHHWEMQTWTTEIETNDGPDHRSAWDQVEKERQLIDEKNIDRYHQWRDQDDAAWKAKRPTPPRPVDLPYPPNPPAEIQCRYPIGWPCLLSLLLPVIWYVDLLKRERRNRRRRADKLCLVCGYDLRSSPERCPECGAESTAKSSTKVRPSLAARSRIRE